MQVVTPALITLLRQHFRLDWRGIHGAGHWARVRHNGLLLCEATGASPRVVEAFAFLHDSCRLDDNRDPHHGARAAAFVRTLAHELLMLNEQELALVCFACEGHSRGGLHADLSVQVCWDADRLDIGRVGTYPNPDRLCTDAARDFQFMHDAYKRSVSVS